MKLSSLLATVGACSGTAMAYDSVVVFNEVHYNAPIGQTEFIELRNLQGVDVNVAGWTLSSGIDFTIPAGTIIPGGGYLVIAAIPAQIPGAIGPFTGQLDNGGETVRLRNLSGRIMDEVNYDDEGEWPVGPDGSGASLARRDAHAIEGAAAWAASTSLGGTPGAENFQVAPVHRSHITARGTWKYRDADAAPPATWANLTFDDTGWTSGNAVHGTPSGAVPSLTVTTDLVERFRASAITGVADGAVVTTWTDEATGDAVSQNAAAGATTPTLRLNVTPSGKPVVRFDGNDELRTTVLPGIPNTGGMTCFAVVKANATPVSGALNDAAGAYVFDRHLTGAGTPLLSLKAVSGRYGLQKRYDSNTGLGGPISTSPISTTAFQIVAVRRNRTLNRWELWVNGVMEGTESDTGVALSADPINIGRHATTVTAGLNGDIAELLIYKSELTQADFLAVGAYLEAEYGLDTAFPGVRVATPLSATAPTSYFRKAFNFPGAPERTSLRLTHTIADGAVFYLNGSEVFRTNMPGGPATHATAANSIVTSPATSSLITVPSPALVNGANVVAVSLHKAAGSPAVAFDATLESTELPPNPVTGQRLRFTEITGAADASFYVELQNVSGAALNTAGWTLVASTGQSVPVPAQSVPAGGYLTINAAALGFTPADGTRFYLMEPGGTVLRDAREVTSRRRGLTAGGTWGHPTTATPGAGNVVVVNPDVVINEIFYHSPTDGPEQWIELYNKSAAPVDISNWKFTDGVSYQFAPATSIPAGGYLVLAWDPAAFAVLHPGVTALGPWSGSLAGKGELISLRDANDNIADQVIYSDSGRWSRWADGGGSSLELKDPRADNNAAEAWDGSDESNRTAWQNVSITATAAHATTNSFTYYNEFIMGLLDEGEILIDDISVREGGTGGGREVIQNGTFTDGTTNKWRSIGTHRTSTVVDDPLLPGDNVLKMVATGATEHMNNHCGTTFKDAATYVTTTVGNTYTITFRAKWLRGSNRLHTRLYFNRLSRQTLLDRVTTGGTPGAVNSRRVANYGPTFSALAVNPVVPAAGESATVSLKVNDADGLSAVDLFTSLNGAAFVSTPMAEANGVYSATIPPQAAGAQVQFYVRAADVPGAFSFFPAAGSDSRAMIPWQDGRSILTLPNGCKPHNVRIVMPAADANFLYQRENLHSNEYRPCTVIYDERLVWYEAGTRTKSSEHGRFQDNRAGFNLKFGRDNPFLGAHTTVSIDRSGNRTTEGLDGTGVTSQREILLKTVMNAAGGIYAIEDDLIRVISPVAAGTPAPAYTGATLTGEALLSKSRFDDEYLDGQWDDGGSGSLFKQEYIYPLNQTIDPVTRAVATIAPAGTLAAAAENPKVPQTGGSPGPGGINVQAYGAPAGTDPKENYRWHWLLRNNRGADDYTGLIAAVTAVGQAQGSVAFRTQTEATLEVDTWLRSAVVPQLFSITDNYLGNGSTHNFILYFPPGGKGVAIPWDSDFLAQSNAQASITAGGQIGKFIAIPANSRRYYGHVLDILNRSFNDAFLTRWATHYACFGIDDMTTSLPFLRARATYVRELVTGTNGRVAPIAKVPFTITTAGPLNVSTPFAAIAGDGWIDVDSIRLQGSTAPLAVTWTDNNSWTLQLPVNAGTSDYTLVAYNRQGAIATEGGGTGMAMINVTGTGGTFPAGPGNLVISEVHFNSAGPDDTTEFIELLNITAATLDLSGCHFDEESGQGIDYTFPNGVTMAPGTRLLVVRNTAAFTGAYPAAAPVAPGVFSGALDNGGESIVLYAASGVEILRTAYADNLGGTDGGGRSLVRVLSSTAPDPAGTAWRQSTADGGNPGATDALAFTGDPVADIDKDSLTALMEYSVGTSDTVFTPLPTVLTVLRQPGGSVLVTHASAPNADDAILTLEASDGLSAWALLTENPVPPGSARKFFRLRAARR